MKKIFLIIIICFLSSYSFSQATKDTVIFSHNYDFVFFTNEKDTTITIAYGKDGSVYGYISFKSLPDKALIKHVEEWLNEDKNRLIINKDK